MYPLKISTAITIPFFAHDVNGDGVTGLVDGGFTKRISKDGGAFAAMTVTITEMENGWYSLPLGTGHTDTLGALTVSLSHASCKRVNLQWRVGTNLPADSVAQTGDSFARLGAPAGASVSADLLTIDNLVDDLESRVGTPSNLGSGATVAANLVDIEGQTDDIGAAGAGLTAVPWNAAWDAEVQSEANDALVANNLDHLCLTAVADTQAMAEVVDNTIIGNILSKSASTTTYDPTTDSLEALRDNTGTAGAGLTSVRLADGAHGGLGAVLTLERIVVASTSPGEPGIKVTGNTSGAGIKATGGTTGDGILATAGGTSGVGLEVIGTGGGEGLRCQGQGAGPGVNCVAGATGHGLYASGGITSGSGIRAEGITNSDGITAVKAGTGVDIRGNITGNVTGNLSGSAGSVTGAVGSVASGGIAAASFVAGAIDAAAIAANAIGASELAADAATEIADALLDRDMSVGTDSGSPTVRTPRQALRLLRNKVSVPAGTMTVTKEDDTTTSWTAAVTTDAAANPITVIDPA